MFRCFFIYTVTPWVLCLLLMSDCILGVAGVLLLDARPRASTVGCAAAAHPALSEATAYLQLGASHAKGRLGTLQRLQGNFVGESFWFCERFRILIFKGLRILICKGFRIYITWRFLEFLLHEGFRIWIIYLKNLEFWLNDIEFGLLGWYKIWLSLRYCSLNIIQLRKFEITWDFVREVDRNAYWCLLVLWSNRSNCCCYNFKIVWAFVCAVRNIYRCLSFWGVTGVTVVVILYILLPGLHAPDSPPLRIRKLRCPDVRRATGALQWRVHHRCRNHIYSPPRCPCCW